MPRLALLSTDDFDRARRTSGAADDRLALLGDMCRLNALVAVKLAGSGHLGSTFSSLDVVVHLLYDELNVGAVGFESPDRDIFFSSKGHDVPGLYAALHGLGVIPTDRLARLRRLEGLDGHPDVGVPGIEANSGSLGMGISKARGMAWAKRRLGRGGRVVVMTGDGELQEGQVWEGLQAAAHERLDDLWVVVDKNEIQSDRPTEEILALGDLSAKLRAFGWEVAECDGHDHAALRDVFSAFRVDGGGPRVLVAHTVKGKGVSFMEHPRALVEGGGTYRWHAGAPDDDAYARAFAELLERIETGFERAALAPPSLEPIDAGSQAYVASEGEPESGAGARPVKVTGEYVVEAFGEALVELGRDVAELVVLDADLASDCRIRAFELAFPERFVQCGIAEQDMVSAAAGLARQGLLPVVNSFASFLASRANEQIYNQASEGTKVVYALHYAGLVPAGPGKSHQSIRDVSLLGALPGMSVVQPTNSEETRAIVRWAVAEAETNVAVRLAIGPSPRRIELPAGYEPAVGCGALLRDGDDGVVLAYGPVLLHEVLVAAELLEQDGIGLRVLAMPWLNRLDRDWLASAVAPFERVIVVEDHAPVGALGDAVRRTLEGHAVSVFGVEGWPACGTPAEALRFHRLDGASLATRIAVRLDARAGAR